jgi:hypothetical protein
MVSVPSHGPALTTWFDPPPEPDGHPVEGLFMAWKGTNDDHNIYWAMNPNPIRQPWTDQQPIDVGTSARPALVEFNGRMILAWKGAPGDSGIYWSSFDWHAQSWSAQQQIAGRGTSHGPAMVVFNRQLHMFWKGLDDDHNVYHAILVDPANGIWGPQGMVVYIDAGNLASGQTPIPIATSDAPAVTVRGDEIILAWKGTENDHALWFSRFSNGSFSGHISVPDVGSEAGPGIGTLDIPVAGSEKYRSLLVLGWRGIDPDHTLWVSALG